MTRNKKDDSNDYQNNKHDSLDYSEKPKSKHIGRSSAIPVEKENRLPLPIKTYTGSSCSGEKINIIHRSLHDAPDLHSGNLICWNIGCQSSQYLSTTPLYSSHSLLPEGLLV